jgi:hypothetical protein
MAGTVGWDCDGPLAGWHEVGVSGRGPTRIARLIDGVIARKVAALYGD